MEIKFTGVVGAPCNKDFASITKIPIDVATSKIRDQLSMLSRFAGSPFVVKVTLSDETLFG